MSSGPATSAGTFQNPHWPAFLASSVICSMETSVLPSRLAHIPAKMRGVVAADAGDAPFRPGRVKFHLTGVVHDFRLAAVVARSDLRRTDRSRAAPLPMPARRIR